MAALARGIHPGIDLEFGSRARSCLCMDGVVGIDGDAGLCTDVGGGTDVGVNADLDIDR